MPPGRRTTGLIALVLLALAFVTPASPQDKKNNSLYYPGHLLVSSRGNLDPRFHKSVLYMVRHNPDSAFGIIINRPFGKGALANMMRGFKLDPQGAVGELELHFGGPVARQHAFFLHSSEYVHEKSNDIDGKISFTKDVKILSAIAAGKGPQHILVALGYAGWSGGQLEREIERGYWTIADANQQLVFGDSKKDLWERVVQGSELPL